MVVMVPFLWQVEIDTQEVPLTKKEAEDARWAGLPTTPKLSAKIVAGGNYRFSLHLLHPEDERVMVVIDGFRVPKDLHSIIVPTTSTSRGFAFPTIRLTGEASDLILKQFKARLGELNGHQ
jgi:hypothetical protein